MMKGSCFYLCLHIIAAFCDQVASQPLEVEPFQTPFAWIFVLLVLLWLKLDARACHDQSPNDVALASKDLFLFSDLECFKSNVQGTLVLLQALAIQGGFLDELLH